MAVLPSDIVVEPLSAPLRGSVSVPGDKSISHRAVLLAAMAKGTSQVSGVLDSADVRASIRAIKLLGARVMLDVQPDLSLAGSIEGWGERGPRQPLEALDCGNSATTARLLMGVLAPWDIRAELTGDASLIKRPMRRIMIPLMKMGVTFKSAGLDTLPQTIWGTSHLRAITYRSPVASAQLKTAVLLAGIYAAGNSCIIEPSASRNHTELMLPEFGVCTTQTMGTVSVEGPTLLHAACIRIPGDPSSAAFLISAAILKPGSFIRVENVSLNPTRIGFVRVLERMGAKVELRRVGMFGREPYGVISASFTPNLCGCEIPADKIAFLVDEIPILALVAAHARGVTVFREVGELRIKESNRLLAIVDTLEALGVDVWVDGNDLYIKGSPMPPVPENLIFKAQKDHRLAMTWAVAGLCGEHPIHIAGYDCVSSSYPQFLDDIERLTR